MEFTRAELYLLVNSHSRDKPLWLVLTDLSGADLRGVDLSGANLRNANLSGANLPEACRGRGVGLAGRWDGGRRPPTSDRTDRL